MNPFEFVIASSCSWCSPSASSLTAWACAPAGPALANQRWRPATRARPHGCVTRSSELKERIKVLERITVDKENSLAKEIESLRDR